MMFLDDFKDALNGHAFELAGLAGLALIFVAGWIRWRITWLDADVEEAVLADINELVGALRNVRNKQPNLEDKINGFIGHLQSIREKTIDILNELKNIK